MNIKTPRYGAGTKLAVAMTIAFAVTLGAVAFTQQRDTPAAGNTLALVPATSLIGTTEGTFSVDGNGAPTYQIEIESPPGTNNNGPGLSFTYSGQRDNGALGMGWALNGIDSVARCNAAQYPNGFTAPVQFTSADRFCMANMSLMLVSGTYGGDGAEYRTWRDTWTKIVSHGVCGSGPCWFSAQNKDGATLRFGYTTGDTGSRILATGRTDGSVRVWSLDRYTDNNGNYTAVSYLNNPLIGEYYPARIDYTGNDRTGLAPQRSVVLEYESRTDRVIGYSGGSPYQLLKRLNSVKTYVGTTLVKNYLLAYDYGQSTARSRVKSIQECASATATPDQCYRPTTFELSNPANGFSQGQVLSTSPSASSVMAFVPMDVNGDGRTDMVEAWKSSSQLQLMTYLSNGTSLNGGTNQNTNNAAGEDGVIGADVNADGLGDIVMPVRNGSNVDFKTFLSNGSGFGPAITTSTGQSNAHLAYLPADVNADGREDLVQVIDDNGKVTFLTYLATGTGTFSAPTRTATTWSTTNNGFLPIDVNGDGRSDIVQPQMSGSMMTFLVGFSNGTGFDLAPAISSGFNPKDPEVQAGDINNDGKADLLLVDNQSTVTVTPFISTGTTFRNTASFTATGGTTNKGIFTANLNGDGRTDVFQALDSGGKLQIVPWYSVSDRFTRGTTFDTGRTSDTMGLRPMEINGDGKQDLLSPEESGGNISFASFINAPGQPDLLSKITNGLNGVTTITHVPMTDTTVYTRGFGAQYPIAENASPMPIVSAYTTTDGRGASYTYTYKYDQARVGYSGIGWLGFGSIRMTDASNQHASIITYSQDYPKNGLVTASEAIDEHLVTLTKSAMQYTDIASASDQQKGIHQVVRTAEEMTMYDNKSGGAKLYTLKKTYGYDAFGNVNIIADLGQIDGPDDDLYTCVRYRNVPASWQLGYSAEEKLIKTAEACRAFIDSTNPVWDPAQDITWSRKTYDDRANLLSNEMWDNSNSVWVTSRFTVDDYGNRLSTTDPASNVTTIAYDPTYHTFPLTITSPPNAAGRQLVDSFEYEPYFGNQTKNVDPNGNSFRWAVDTFGRVVDTYSPNASGAETRTENVQWGSDANGNYVSTSTRPAWSSSDDPATWAWEKTYFDAMLREYRTESRGISADKTVVNEVSFDSSGRENRTSVPYFINGTPQWITTTFDAYNRPVTSTDPDGTIEKIDYQLGALKVYRTSAYGTPDAQTEIDQFDVHGLITSRIMANGAIYKYLYSRGGTLLQVNTLPDRRQVNFTYDSLGRLRSITSPNTGTTNYHYDAKAQMTGLTDADGNTVTYTYDGLGRILTALSASGGTNFTTRYTYDGATANGLGNLTNVQMSSAPVGNYSFDFGYDAYRQTSTVRLTLPRGAYTYGFDYAPNGDVTRRLYPDGAALDITYPVLSQPSTFALTPSGGQAETYISYADYNPYGTPLTTTYKNGVEIKRTFYPNDVATGKLKTIEAKRAGATLYSRVIAWNRLGLVTGQTDPNTSGSSTYGYDPKNMGFLTSAKGPHPDQTFGYDTIGNRKLKDATPYTYVSGTDKLATFGPSTGAEWNANGTLKTLTNGGQSFTFTYDARGQLIKATNGAATGNYTYDFAGNALVQQPPGQNFTLYNIASDYEIADYGNNNTTTTKYIEGLFGRTVSITTNGSAVRNAAVVRNNRMLEARLSGPAHGIGGTRRRGAERAVLMLSMPSVRARLYEVQLLALWLLALIGAAMLRRAARRRRAATDYARREPLFAPLVPIVILAFVLVAVPADAALTPGGNGAGNPTAGTLFFAQDVVGSTVSVTDDAGNTTAAVGYEVFGAVSDSASTGTDNFRPKFAGQRFDTGVNAYDFGARYYDQNTGRFITPDPEAQWVNPYVYAANSPVSLTDPTGEFAFLVAIIIGALVGAYMGAAAVNHDYNPANWDWKSGKTYAGLFGGALIGAVGGAIVEVAATAGVAAGIAGAMLVGAGENAAFTAMGGGSLKEILISAAEGAAFGFVFGAAGAGLSRLFSRFARRGASALAEAGEGAENAAARGLREACASFVGGQEVVAANGKLQPIETLRVGDRVMGQEIDRERNGAFPVGATLDGYTDEVTRVVTGSGNVIETTPGHLFRAYGMGWVRADELNSAMSLTSIDGKAVAIASVETRLERRPVFNFSVETAENYFVSPDRVLVKNVRAACLIAKGNRRPGWRRPSKEIAFARQTIKSGKYKGYIKSSVSNERYLRSAKVKIGKNNPRFISRWQLDHRTPYKYLLWAADQTGELITWKDMIKISNFSDNLRWLTMAENVSHRFEPLQATGRRGAIAIFKALGYWS